MSLKLIKQTMKARPSKSSFISDFDSEHSSSLISEQLIKPAIFSHFNPNPKENPENSPEIPTNSLKSPLFLQETGNEDTVIPSKSSYSGQDLKDLRAEDLGPYFLSPHTISLVNRVLFLYNARKLGKMQHYFSGLRVFSDQSLGNFPLDPKEIYTSLELSGFDVVQTADARVSALFNGYSALKRWTFSTESPAEVASFLPLGNDCYSMVQTLDFPFENGALLGLFSGPLLQTDLCKEKTVKIFEQTPRNQPFSLAKQRETSFFAGDVAGNVSIFDFRVKKLVDKLALSPPNAEVFNAELFNAVAAIDTRADFLMANSREIVKIWDLRRLEKPVFSHVFQEKRRRKAFFCGDSRVLDVTLRENETNAKSSASFLDFQSETPRVFKEITDFKGKSVNDVAEVKEIKGFAFLCQGNPGKCEVSCYSFEANARKSGILRKKLVNRVNFAKNYRKIRLSAKAEVLGVANEKECEIRTFLQRDCEKDVKNRLKIIIN